MRIIILIALVSLSGCDLFEELTGMSSGASTAEPTTEVRAVEADRPMAEHKHADGKACTCARGRAGGAVWCESCQKGYVNGKATRCKSCWKGKTSDKAVWCDDCNTGYISGKKITCKTCFNHVTGSGPACSQHPGGPGESAAAADAPARAADAPMAAEAAPGHSHAGQDQAGHDHAKGEAAAPVKADE